MATDDELREYWQVPAIREHMMAAVREHHKSSWPGRPYAWWRLEAGEDRPGPLTPAWAEAVRLLELGELDYDELVRLPRLISHELVVRRQRVRMDPPEYLAELEALAERLGVEDG